MNTYQGSQNRPRKKSLGNVCVILSSEIFKVVGITNKKTVSIPASYREYFFLGACFYSQFSSLSVRSSLMFNKYLQGAQWQVPFLFEKKKNQPKRPLVVIRCRLLLLAVIRYNSLSFVVTRYHSLSLVITCCHSLSLIVTRCHSLYHSLSFVVTRCHSLSMDVSLVCLFIND